MFRLRIQGGARNGETLALAPGKTYVVGRAREADFRFPDDETMSRAHAEIVPDGQGGWSLRNKSQWGSLVGGAKIDADRKLAPGDVLTCGGSTFVFELDPTAGGDVATRPPGGAVPATPPPMPGSSEPSTPQPMPRPGAPATPAATPDGSPAIGATATAPGAAQPASAGGKPALPAGKGSGNTKIIVAALAAFVLLFCCCPGSWYAFNVIRAYKAAHGG